MLEPQAEGRTEVSAASIFRTKDGLRAGWRLLIYFSLVVGFYFLLRQALHLLPSGLSHTLWRDLIGESGLLAVVTLPALLMSAFERRPFGVYGLPAHQAFGKLFWTGAAWGLVAISCLILSLRGLGDFFFGHIVLHPERALKFAVFWGVFFLLVGFFEEFLVRGYTQFTLSQGIYFWPAALILSAAFGAIHLGNPGETGVGILAAALIGLFLCLTLRRTGTLWFAVGFHAAWDWGESYLYSVPDSGVLVRGHLLSSSLHGSRWLTGGSVGPEGSLLIFVILVALFAIFNHTYPQVNTPVVQRALVPGAENSLIVPGTDSEL
ncbi:MAG: CPBP family intramembrane metalloprotease [Acidobacteriales bacterium]|nr:CPBP family intramembrane metalloprotease [Terriglobales bacterium]